MKRMRSEKGQSTVEYLIIVAILLVAATGIGNAFRARVQGLSTSAGAAVNTASARLGAFVPSANPQ